MRDYRKLRVFQRADAAVIRVYQATRRVPADERFGLQAQIRRAAVSVPTNIVEGSARQSTASYLAFLDIASGSAAEARYLVDLAHRLRFIADDDCECLVEEYSAVLGGLTNLIHSLSNAE
jgi:four helix bundle protein